jgi:hypothetical protein
LNCVQCDILAFALEFNFQDSSFSTISCTPFLVLAVLTLLDFRLAHGADLQRVGAVGQSSNVPRKKASTYSHTDLTIILTGTSIATTYYDSVLSRMIFSQSNVLFSLALILSNHGPNYTIGTQALQDPVLVISDFLHSLRMTCNSGHYHLLILSHTNVACVQ